MRITEILSEADGSWYDAISGMGKKFQQASAAQLAQKATTVTVMHKLQQAQLAGQDLPQATKTVKAELLKLNVSDANADSLLKAATDELQSRTKYQTGRSAEQKAQAQSADQAMLKQTFQSEGPTRTGVVWLMPYQNAQYFKSYTGNWYEKTGSDEQFNATHPMPEPAASQLDQVLGQIKFQGQVREIPVKSTNVSNAFVRADATGTATAARRARPAANRNRQS